VNQVEADVLGQDGSEAHELDSGRARQLSDKPLSSTVVRMQGSPKAARMWMSSTVDELDSCADERQHDRGVELVALVEHDEHITDEAATLEQETKGEILRIFTSQRIASSSPFR
jgi:hypothetical protein